MKLIIVIVQVFILLCSCHMPNEQVYTKLHPKIYKLNNQFFYGEKVHTYLIDLDDKVLLFDIPVYSEEVENFILSFEKPVVAILSHGSCGISDGTKWQEKIGLKVYAHIADTNHPWLRMKPDVFFTELPEFGSNVEVIGTPGHSAGSICLIERSTKSLFTGDTFHGDENGEIKDFTRKNPSEYENLPNRLKSCEKLLNYDFVNVYPFHYEIIEGTGKIALDNFLKRKK